MTANDIYQAALHLLSEAPVESDPEDYEERAPYLIASFCSECKRLDYEYRAAFDEMPQPAFGAVCIPLEDDFPLSDRFSSPAVLYVAAMLVVDDDVTLSDRLYEKYCDSISTVYREIPARREAILNLYE